jgi:DNA ligase-1
MIEVAKIVKQLENTSSSNDKIAIIKQHSDNEVFKNVLKYTYDSNLNYGFSESNLRKLLDNTKSEDILENTWQNGFDMLDILATSNINDALRRNVITFLWCQLSEVRELFIRILTKDLRCNISSKTINKAIPKLITEWEVQQGYPLEKVKLKNEEWIALSLKLNGIRSTYFKGQFKSRQNKIMHGFDHIASDIAKLEKYSDYVFDGELIRKNVDDIPDNENFRLTTSIVNSDAEDKSEIQLVIFDMLPTHEFISGQSSKTFKDRLVEIQEVKHIIDKIGLENIDIAPTYYTGRDHSKINEVLDAIHNAGMEGAMLLRDMPYKCKRHNGVLKCKKFMDVDLKVVGYEEGSGKHSGKLGSLIVEYKNNTVNVGSGFTDAQREEYWNNREQLIGKIVAVKYKEETMDKKTKLPSLQFPTFIAFKTDKDVADC